MEDTNRNQEHERIKLKGDTKDKHRKIKSIIKLKIMNPNTLYSSQRISKTLYSILNKQAKSICQSKIDYINQAMYLN